MSPFVLILLTSLDGTPIWVEGDFVQIIRPSYSQCHTGNATAVQVGGRALCVRESPEEIKRKLEEARR